MDLVSEADRGSGFLVGRLQFQRLLFGVCLAANIAALDWVTRILLYGSNYIAFKSKLILRFYLDTTTKAMLWPVHQGA